MQKIKKTKTLVDAAKIGAQTKIAFEPSALLPYMSRVIFYNVIGEDVSDVPTVLPGSFVQLEFKSRMCVPVATRGAAAAGPLGGMVGG